MRLDSDPHIQVSGGPPEGPIFALAPQDELGSVIDSWGNLDAELVLPGLQAFPSAGFTGDLRDPPSSLASITRDHT